MKANLRWAIKRLRLRMFRGVRHHYMLAFSVVALAVALAGTGVFEAGSQPGGPVPEAQPDLANAAASAPSGSAGPAVTFYLVRTEAQRDLLNWSKSLLIYREWLSEQTYQALVAGTPEQEAAARARIAEAVAGGAYSQVIVEDMRGEEEVARLVLDVTGLQDAARR